LNSGDGIRRQQGAQQGRGADVQTIRPEDKIGRRGIGSRGIIVGCAGVGRIDIRIERAFAGWLTSVEIGFAGRGVAVLACKLAGLPRPAIDLARLRRTTGRALWILGLAIVVLAAL